MGCISGIERLIPAIYEAASAPDGWDDVLCEIARMVGVDAVFHAQLPFGRLAQGRVWAHEIDPRHIADFMREDVIGHSAYAVLCTQMPVGKTADVAQSFSDPRVLGDPAVEMFLRPAKLVEGGFGTASRDDEMIAPLACLNSAVSGALDLSQTALMRELMPHVGHAARIQARLARLTGAFMILSDSLNRLNLGVLSVTDGLSIRHANAEAERILACEDGFTRRLGRLRLADAATSAALRREIAALSGQDAGTPPGCVFVRRPSGAPPYTVVVAPAGAVTAAGGAAAATLFITDPVGPTTLPVPAILADAFGLSATEAEVMRLAAMGRGTGFVAASLGISLNTARTHLKAIYAKTGVNHQAALARMIVDAFPPVRGLNGVHDGAPRA